MATIFGALNPLAFCGLMAGILSVLAFLPYIRDMFRGTTRPLRASWLIWSVLSSISFASQVVEGAGDSLWFAGVQMSATVLIFGLSVWFGTGGYLSGRDGATLGLAAIGLVMWVITDTPAYALAVSIAISLTGGSVTVWKAYQAPETETVSTWALGFLASCLALVAVGGFDPMLLAYPAYLFVLNGAIVVAILAGRARKVPVAAQVVPAE